MLNTHSRPGLALLAVWVICTAFNLTKAFHVDDTAHLEIAQAILADPFHPMSVEVNWVGTRHPIHEMNQPHLFIYIMAGVMKLFGTSEIVLHLLMAFFTGLSLWICYRLLVLRNVRSALWITTVLGLGPAFLPAQNVMVDVPLLAVWLLFFFALINPRQQRESPHFAAAAWASAAACLIKYTSLVLLPILGLSILMRRDWRRLWVLLIPIISLAAWSLFNYVDYGSVHLLGRPTQPLRLVDILNRSVDWLAGVGAITPFAVLFIMPATYRKQTWWALVPGALAAGVIGFLTHEHLHASTQISILWALFVGNGLFVTLLAMQYAWEKTRDGWRQGRWLGVYPWVVPLLWMFGVAGFVILFAPFLAVRHVLLALPAVLLLLPVDEARRSSPAGSAVALALTILLGTGLAWSDHRYAAVYRDQAQAIRATASRSTSIWFVGHWGWQWYAKQAGMKQYDPASSTLREGDLFIMPVLITWTTVAARHEHLLEKIAETEIPAGPGTWLRTMARSPRGGYYVHGFSNLSPPWRFSTQPLERFVAFRVTADEERRPD